MLSVYLENTQKSWLNGNFNQTFLEFLLAGIFKVIMEESVHAGITSRGQQNSVYYEVLTGPTRDCADRRGRFLENKV